MKGIIHLVFLTAVITAIVWLVIYLAGRTKKNKDAKSFIQQLAYLDVCVNYGLIDEHSVRFINEEFNRIESMPDADPGKIRDLKARFRERYIEFLHETTEY